MAKAQSQRTHCPAGHPYDDENTIRSGGKRRCKTCTYARWREAHPPTRGIQPTLAERLWASFVREPSGCWRWTRKLGPDGYGRISIDGQAQPAHRVMYELVIAPIASDLTADHQCHNQDQECDGGPGCRHRACVNPSHVIPATTVENVMRGEGFGARNARKTHCPKGHPYSPENTYINPTTGHRACRLCRSAYWRTYRRPSERTT